MKKTLFTQVIIAAAISVILLSILALPHVYAKSSIQPKAHPSVSCSTLQQERNQLISLSNSLTSLSSTIKSNGGASSTTINQLNAATQNANAAQQSLGNTIYSYGC